MAKAKLLILLYIPTLTIGIWKFFESDTMVSVILFNSKWKEYPEYYAYDTSFLLSICVLSYVVWQQAKILYSSNVIKFTKFCFILSVVRIIDYWCFHDLFSATTYHIISALTIIAIITKSDIWLSTKYGKVIYFIKAIFNRSV